MITTFSLLEPQSGTKVPSEDMLAAALYYASQGLPVIPIRHGRSRTPLVVNCREEATLEPEQILDWWIKWPSANVGLVLGTVDDGDILVVDARCHAANVSGTIFVCGDADEPLAPTLEGNKPLVRNSSKRRAPSRKRVPVALLTPAVEPQSTSGKELRNELPQQGE
jgi:hypothetical protein